MTRMDMFRLKAISGGDRSVVALALAERARLLELLGRFETLDQDPHVTDAEWSTFRREVHEAVEAAKGDNP